jgi:hypothetical protein
MGARNTAIPPPIEPSSHGPRNRGGKQSQKADFSVKFVVREFAVAFGIYALLWLGGWYAVQHLPEGKAYVLESRGEAAGYDFLLHVVVVTLFVLLYMWPAMFARRTLAIVAKVGVVGLFVVFLSYMEFRRYIAVVETDTQFIFVRCYPASPEVILKKDLPRWELSDYRDPGNGRRHVTLFHFKDSNRLEGKECWKNDAQTHHVFDALTQALVSHGARQRK